MDEHRLFVFASVISAKWFSFFLEPRKKIKIISLKVEKL